MTDDGEFKILDILEPYRDPKSMVIVRFKDHWNLVTSEGTYQNIPIDLLREFLQLEVAPKNILGNIVLTYEDGKDIFGNIVLRRLQKSARAKIHKFMKARGFEVVR